MGKDDAGYYGILPAEVRYDKELLPNAKLLFVEITALCRKQGYCWATNSYFAELFNTTERTIKRWVKILSDKGYCTTVLKTFRWDDGTIKKVRYICLSKQSAEEIKSLSQSEIWERHHSDIERQNHSDTDVTYNNINNELDNNLDTKVSKEQSSEILPTNEVVRTQRSLDIDQAFVIWEEVMGYPLAANKTDRNYINILLNKKGMDLDKLRNMVRLVEASQHDKYKRFSITNYTELYYKTNDLMAWAKEKQAQMQTNQTVAEI